MRKHGPLTRNGNANPRKHRRVPALAVAAAATIASLWPGTAWAAPVRGASCGSVNARPVSAVVVAGPTALTHWRIRATGASGSYLMTRSGVTLFTVHVGDSSAQINAAIDTWIGAPGAGGSVTGNWANWDWTFPGAFPAFPLAADAAPLVRGTASAVRTSPGHSGHAPSPTCPVA